MRHRLILLILMLLPFVNLNASPQKLYSMPGIQVIPIKDSDTNKQYELFIKLPEKYHENKDKNYPVVYFTDAVWHIELLSSATNFILEDVILVGISWQKDAETELIEQVGPYVSRFSDYSIKKSTDPEKQAKYQFGRASHHLDFIRNDVFKFIESGYRTDPDNRTYFGFSLGGLFGTYALLTQPDTFNNYILGSPSIWNDADYLFSQQSPALKNKGAGINVLISYGELEKELSKHIDDFISRLKSAKYQSLSSIHQLVIESSGHSDSFPMLGVRSVKWLANLQPKANKQ